MYPGQGIFKTIHRIEQCALHVQKDDGSLNLEEGQAEISDGGQQSQEVGSLNLEEGHRGEVWQE